MKAKAINDGVCPRCGADSLVETRTAGGGKKHECVGGRWGCAYLMVWKPTEAEVSPNEPN